MGVSDFLSRVLESAGRPLDLRDPQFVLHGGITVTERIGPNKRRRRPMRIAVDVSSWVYKAAHGYGDMLGDERHLTNYGRANLHDEEQQHDTNTAPGNLSEEKIQAYVQACKEYVLGRLKTLQETTKAQVLVVLDGSTPPIKEQEVERRAARRREQEDQRDRPVDPQESPSRANLRRTRAFRRAGAGRFMPRITKELLVGLQESRIPFMVAPYEADGQLAYLSDLNYIDLVITEDSDMVAHGVNAILYKSIGEIGNETPKGQLLRFVDIGSVKGSNLNLMDFTPVMMAVLFVAVGCDYCDNLKGIGLMTASRLIRAAFLTPHNPYSQQQRRKGGASSRQHQAETSESKLRRVLEALYYNSYLDSRTLTEEFKTAYEERFLAAIFMYRHPIVYDPIRGDNVIFKRQRRTAVESEQTLQDSNAAKESQPDDPPAAIDVEDLGDIELLDHEAYAALCRDPDRIAKIVGSLRSKEEASLRVQGLDQVPPSKPLEDVAPNQGDDNEGNDSAEQGAAAQEHARPPNDASQTAGEETMEHETGDDMEEEQGLDTQPAIFPLPGNDSDHAAAATETMLDTQPEIANALASQDAATSAEPNGAVHEAEADVPGAAMIAPAVAATPERTQASNTSSQPTVSTGSKMQSPLLLYSTTPEPESSQQDTAGTDK